MDLKEAKEMLLSQEWIFAKTMPENPHEYCLRKNFKTDSDFVDLVMYIRTSGVREKYKGYFYPVLYLGGWKYWTFYYPINNHDGSWKEKLINRCRT